MSKRNLFLLCVVASLFLVTTAIPTKSNPDPVTILIAGRNVNMVSGTELPDGDPYLQRQNEPSIAVSTRNPLHLLAGANDYRSIDIAMEDELPGFEQTSSAPAPDAWLGVFKSIDGGSTWTSTLLPGFSYYDTTPPGAPFSPLYGFSAAADPVVRAGPNGLFFYAGIAFNREDRGDSAVFVSRFIDNNNKENVDTTAYIDTQIQARGNAGQFIDKPWLAVDVPYQEEPSIPIDLPYLQDPYTDRQYVTRCNVYLAYSVFLGNPYKTPRTKIYFARSTDSGMTWDKPTKLTETQHINQGAVIAIDPRGNGHVYVAWRRFAHMNNKGKIIQPDAIVVAKSEDGGRRFSKPIVVAELAPWFPPSDDGVFDQATTAESFRTNDYPTMAVDHNGTAYIAWAQRGLGPDINPGTGVGEARIVMTASSNGDNWSTPEQVISYEEGDPPGHQFMPQLTYAAGKLTLLWYDQRWDVIQEYLPFIEDIYTNVRHTIDVRVAQAEIHSYPEFSPSTQVSKYPFLLWPSDTPGYFNALQLLYNKPNLPIFAHGTVPFLGDYIGITPSPMFLPPEDPNNPTDYWIYNTDPLTPTHYHAVWTDNRDVIPPGEDNWLGDWDQYNAPGTGCIEEDLTGVRNQNIYTSRISEGILAGSPGNTKPLNILRSFVVFVHNTTKFEKFFTLQIEKPDDMTAYFWQEGGGQPENIFVSVPPYSYLSNTILVGQYTPDEYASIIIKIYDEDTGALVSYVTLNPDSTNPWLDQPEGVDPDNPHARNEGETHTPHARNYSIIDWNYELQDPYINTIHPQYDEAIANNDGVTPYPVDGTGKNPHARNPHARNPHARNPHARNNVLNPHARNENIPSDIPEDSHMTDVVWTIENAGNTTTSYSINTFPTPEDLPDGILAQLIVFKTYTTPTVDPYGDEDPNSEGTNGCELIEQEHQEMIVMKTPHARNLSELGDISVLVPPKETFHVLYRFYNPYQSTEQQEFHDEEKFEEAVPEVESDVPDTDPLDPTQPLPEPPKLLVIPPQVLPVGVAGEDYPGATLQADGGTGTYGNWTVIDGSFPSGLSLDPNTGDIAGKPTTDGEYSFKVQVNDFDNGYLQQTAMKWLSITVYLPPDLAVESLTHVPVNPNTLEQMIFTAVVKNIGQGPSRTSTLMFKIGGETPGTPQTLYNVPALQPGETYTETRQTTLGVALAYINTAEADYGDNLYESDETNNTTTDSYIVTLPPDLIVEPLTHSPGDPNSLEQITFTAVVKNVGAGPAGASTLMFKIGGETPGAPATLFAVPALSPGATHTETRQTTLPAKGYINTAEADYNDDLVESDETNNVTTDSYTVLQPPDLIVDSLTHSPANPTTLDTITFSATVKNNGTGPSRATTLMFKIGGETPGAPATLFAVPALSPGATHTETRQTTLPAKGYINTAEADYNDDVTESDETNNVTTDSFTVIAVPDLIVQSLTHSPADPNSLEQITFTAVVKNIGAGPAGASTLMFKIGGETPGAPTTLFAVPALSPGATHTETRQTTLPAKGYINTAEADYNDDLVESDETNNVTTDSYTVTLPPDLIVHSLTHSPANPTSVDLITFTAVVKNNGTGPSRTSVLMFKIGGETPGTQPTIFNVPVLNPGATHTVTRQATLIAQNYTNTAEADYKHDNVESNEGNNVTTDSYIVVDLTAPIHISPASGTVYSHYPRATTIEWQAVTGAASYEVQCQIEYPAWSEVWYDYYYWTGITATNYTWNFVGAQRGRWRVRAVSATGGKGPWSGYWWFRYTI
jgi:subtilase family serine protease